MKLKYLFLLFIFAMSLSNAQANSILINFSQKQIENKYSSSVNKIKNFIATNYFSQIKNPIYINISIDNQNKKLPSAKIFNNYCLVDINLQRESPIIFSNFEDELNFLVLHETAHCLLGSEEIINEKINFISNEEENNLLIKDTSISCDKCRKKTSFNPYIAYSEIFADIFAINYYLTKNTNIDFFLLELQKYRYNEYYKNEQITNYLSHFYIEDMFSNHQSTKKTFQEMLKKSQDILIYFIKERFVGINFTKDKSIIK